MNKKWRSLILVVIVILLIVGMVKEKKKYDQYKNTGSDVLSLMNRELLQHGVNNYGHLNWLLKELEKGSITMIQFDRGILDVTTYLNRATLAEYTLANTHWNYIY